MHTDTDCTHTHTHTHTDCMCTYMHTYMLPDYHPQNSWINIRSISQWGKILQVFKKEKIRKVNKQTVVKRQGAASRRHSFLSVTHTLPKPTGRETRVKILREGLWKGGRAPASQAWWCEFNLQNPCKGERKEPAPRTYPLTSTHISFSHTYTSHTHAPAYLSHTYLHTSFIHTNTHISHTYTHTLASHLNHMLHTHHTHTCTYLSHTYIPVHVSHTSCMHHTHTCTHISYTHTCTHLTHTYKHMHISLTHISHIHYIHKHTSLTPHTSLPLYFSISLSHTHIQVHMNT